MDFFPLLPRMLSFDIWYSRDQNKLLYEVLIFKVYVSNYGQFKFWLDEIRIRLRARLSIFVAINSGKSN